ncbi:MAG TPA: hypothetical protein VIM40_11815, partial [Arthrobacter sp.]
GCTKFETSCKNQTTPRGGGSSQFNQFNTINWYQQTWHTIEFSNNRHIRIIRETIHIQMNSFVSLFFAAMFIAYFILIHFANPGYFPDVHSVERIRPTKSEAFHHISCVAHDELLLL